MAATIARLVGRLVVGGARTLWAGPLSSKAGVLLVLAILVVFAGPTAGALLAPTLLVAFLFAIFGVLLRGRA